MVTFSGDDVPPLVSHSSHPRHTLKLVATGGELFQCNGCMQFGQERRYRCEQCDFDLHICCARAPAGFEHPMFEGRALTFFHSSHLRPGMRPGSIPWCDVCGNQVLGFLYHNREHDLDIHPPCAILPERLVEDDGRALELHKATGHKCGLCGQDGYRGLYLAYRLQDQDDDGEHVYLHVACLLEANYCSNGQLVQASSQSQTATGEVGHGTLVNAPTTGELAALPNAPARKTGRFRRFCKIAFLVARVSFAVTTMDPVGLVTAIASPV